MCTPGLSSRDSYTNVLLAGRKGGALVKLVLRASGAYHRVTYPELRTRWPNIDGPIA